MEITVTKKYRERGVGNTYNYKTITSAGIVYTPTPPVVISFNNTQYPTIDNYQEDYAALYGPWPRVQLFTFEENVESGSLEEVLMEREDKPKRTILNDVLDSIVWDLGYVDSGIIILYPTT